MRIPLDAKSSVPLYRQIEQFLRQQIKSSVLAAETRLPASRELATGLGVSRVTVINAYAELEAAGLVYSLQGSGTFVAPLPAALVEANGQQTAAFQSPPWQEAFANPVATPTMEQFHQQVEASNRSDLIEFISGMGSAEFFSVDDFRKTLQAILRRDGASALGYGGDSAGYGPLRNTIAQILSSEGIPTHTGQVLITSGSQQALSITARLLLRPGDAVLVEDPTYGIGIELFESLDARLVPVAMDSEGLKMDALESALRLHHPRLIYTIPTFHNPTGISMSTYRRKQLVSLAMHYNVPILEDDFVGDLRYEGHARPALKALDPGGYVIYVNTFSKTLAPGLRIGFLVVSGPVYEQLLVHKRNSDYATSDLIQRALDAYITVGRYQSHLRRVRRTYRQRRDAMLQALSEVMPASVSWQRPSGGLFVWLKLPPQITADDLFPIALREGVTFAPGSAFFADRQPRPVLRLNYAVQPPEAIAKGIGRLGRALQKMEITP